MELVKKEHIEEKGIEVHVCPIYLFFTPIGLGGGSRQTSAFTKMEKLVAVGTIVGD